MSYRTMTLKITGVCALLMHNGQLADPLNHFAKEIKKISGKRDKTEADYEQMAKLEFLGSLYLAQQEPCLPGEMLEASMIEGAKKKKRGNQAKAGLLCDGMYPLAYDGPRDPHALWADGRFRLSTGVRVQRNRVIRTRPRFEGWSAEVEIKYMPSLLNESEVRDIIKLVGEIVGLGDWRPRFGRFVTA
jgi:hypothetical protein